jgi:Predicted membrane protein
LSRKNKPPAKRPNSPAPSQKAPGVSSSTSITVQKSEFHGPLPPPELLRQYNDIIPDAAERIMLLFEQQAAHRMDLERRTIYGDNKRAGWGIVCGTVVSLTVLGAATYLVATGHDWAGATLAGIDIAGIVGVFVYGTNIRRKEREAKREATRRATG